MTVTDEQVMAKIEAVMAALKLTFACANADAPFAIDTEVREAIERFVMIAPALRDEALADLVSAMPTPAQGICAKRLMLSLIVAYGLGAGLKLPAITRTASA